MPPGPVSFFAEAAPMKWFVCLFGLLAFAGAAPAAACDLRESYVARLSAADHFNSRGERLTSAAAIIRQDRANYHLFGIRDPEDEGDVFFSSKANREILERMLENGSSTRQALFEIVNGTPLVVVTICQDHRGDYINVIVK
jgi:hypothetical protein